jgi:endonuclease G
MRDVEHKLLRLKALRSQVRDLDPELAEDSEAVPEASAASLESTSGPAARELALESIIMRRERPVLAIKEDAPELVFPNEADSLVWKKRLSDAEPLIRRAIPAVGRIELFGGPLDWVGTGWLVDEDILVTNRHVAVEFAEANGEGFTFRQGEDGPLQAGVDFLEEIGSEKSRLFQLLYPMHIEEAPGPDVAFFRVSRVSGGKGLARHVELAERVAQTNNVAVIGYPAYDSRIPDADLMSEIFGDVYDKKRLAPGAVTRVQANQILHNCTTLGGNSGSVVLDLDTGKALGLHFSGSFLTANYAVRADVVAELLDRARRGVRRRPAVEAQAPAPAAAGGVVHQVTIPLTVTVTVGEPAAMPPSGAGAGHDPRAPLDDDIAGEEGVVEDYRDREGYDPGFLGVDVPLPSVTREARDVLEFELDGKVETELRYEHFSTVMSRSRRVCMFSAVNIDGRQSRKTPRVGWRWDPRIPRRQQIMNECYGPPPRFSRGHMTRREDPAWGSEAEAMRGNADSMHVTNTAPQMQAFNAPIWLALEDYALGHARQDKMRISVFTGPYLSASDPIRYGVRIPTLFWKVIAFIHDETGELCATGYEMDQTANLQPEAEFVFGPFRSPQLDMAVQVPVARIARRAGLDLGPLPGADPLAGSNEGRTFEEGRGIALATLEQIRFR